MDQLTVQLPDGFTIAQILRNFGRHLMVMAANSPVDSDVFLRYDREMLMEVSAMMDKYIVERNEEQAS